VPDLSKAALSGNILAIKNTFFHSMKLTSAPQTGFPLRSNKPSAGYQSGIHRSQPTFPSSVAGRCGGLALFELWRVTTPFLPVAPLKRDFPFDPTSLQGILAKANKYKIKATPVLIINWNVICSYRIP
jgi:hypothetical protein